MNKAILIGRLTKSIELKKTQDQKSVANFILAVNRSFTNANGEREADFINCVVWDKIADNLSLYTSKGSLIGVEGRIQTRNYDDNNGNKVYITEVVAQQIQFLDTKGTNQANNQAQPMNNNSNMNSQQEMHDDANDFFDSFNTNNDDGLDLPF